jgi:hypothetical protein
MLYVLGTDLIVLANVYIGNLDGSRAAEVDVVAWSILGGALAVRCPEQLNSVNASTYLTRLWELPVSARNIIKRNRTANDTLIRSIEGNV